MVKKLLELIIMKNGNVFMQEGMPPEKIQVEVAPIGYPLEIIETREKGKILDKISMYKEIKKNAPRNAEAYSLGLTMELDIRTLLTPVQYYKIL